MAKKRNKSRGIEEIAHYFLSCGDLLSTAQDSAPAPPLETIEAFPLPEEGTEGKVVLNRNRVVTMMNATASRFLRVRAEDLVGQMFNYFIKPNEKSLVSILRDNGRNGVGEMCAEELSWKMELFYLISIVDITDTLLEEDGRIRLPFSPAAPAASD